MRIGSKEKALMLRFVPSLKNCAMAGDFPPCSSFTLSPRNPSVSLNRNSSAIASRSLVTSANVQSGTQPDLSITSASVTSKPVEVAIAMGANLGDRMKNFNSAVKLMKEAGIQVKKHACLYETVPMHLLDQPLFLNSAVTAVTSMEGHELLRVLKRIENQLGRSSGGVKYGPRPIDLDIILYGSTRYHSEELQVPHAMYPSRPFVLAPLMDLLDPASHWYGEVLKHWNDVGGAACVAREGMRRLLPVGGQLLDWEKKTYVMGILNVTPDSFSDGGKFVTMDKAVRRAKEIIVEGADFIDIGAQSTRPNATRLSTEQELERLLPVLEKVVELRGRDKVLVSVDTFDAKVARAALAMGADLINDVSAGSLDPEMLQTLAELEAPCVLMHMRGNPCTMLSEENTKYGDLANDVAAELGDRIEQAEAAGVPAWSMIVDPGFGFSKTAEQNVELLATLDRFKAGVSRKCFRFPVLAGVSRKGFLGRICGHDKGEDRDMATIAAVTAVILKGANVVRAHNVRGVRDAVLVVDALRKYSYESK